jgi:hypothetical protein
MIASFTAVTIETKYIISWWKPMVFEPFVCMGPTTTMLRTSNVPPVLFSSAVGVVNG